MASDAKPATMTADQLVSAWTKAKADYADALAKQEAALANLRSIERQMQNCKPPA